MKIPKKALSTCLVVGMGLSRLVGDGLAKTNWNADHLIVGKFTEARGDEKCYGLTLETIKGNYKVYVINCAEYPISRRLKEIKLGDYLEIRCGLHSDEPGNLDCVTDSCLVKKLY